jgi:hypothetical protein
MGWTTEDSRRGQEIVLFPITSTPALGPTQPLIQWVPGAISSREKRQVRESYHSLPFSAEVKNDGAISPLPYMASWRGV